MKRLFIRLSILSVVVGSGVFAIAQARHGLQQQDAGDEADQTAALPADAPQPIRVTAIEEDAPDAEDNPLHTEQRRDLNARVGRPPQSEAMDEIPPASVVLAGYNERDSDNKTTEGNNLSGASAGEVRPQNHDAGGRYSLSPAGAPTVQVSDSPEPARGNFVAGQEVPTSEALPSSNPLRGSVVATPARELQNPGVARRVPRESDYDAQQPLSAPNTLEQGPELQRREMVEPRGRAIEDPTGTPIDDIPVPEVGGDSGIAAALQGEGAGRPGATQLEGVQSPTLVLQKMAPAEIQVGKECRFEIVVRNTGQAAAHGVEIHDEIPRGTSLVSSEPRASLANTGELVWKLGTLEPGAETKVAMVLMPTEEGEIGSIATVRFEALASVRTLATKPELELWLSAPPTVMIDEQIHISIRLSNPGSGAATGVMLMENIPQGMEHPAGDALEYEVGTLAPGESREMELVLTAAEAGKVTNLLVAQADANLRVTDQAEFEVIAPALVVDVQGPKRRYLERPATYVLSVENPGTASAREVELTSYLPKGMKFVKANNSGQYDPRSHSVTWGLAELPAKQAGSVELVAVPVEPGEQQLRVAGKADQGLADEADQVVSVEGLAAVLFTVADVNDPIEVGGETSYEIHVVNQGSKASTNVQVVALLPPDMKAVSAEGPTRYTLEAGRVVFAPLSRLAPKADTTYEVKVQTLRPGDQRIRVQLLTDEMRTPVTKEESTRVYADE